MILNRNIFKEKREAKGLSLDDLAIKLDVKSNKLKKIENFEEEIEYKYLSKIKEILDINDQEIKEYFDSYNNIQSKETKTIRRSLVLNLSSLAYLLCYIPMVTSNWFSYDNLKYIFTISLVGFTSLVGSYVSFVSSKKFISNKKYYIYLTVFTILFVLCLATYVFLMFLICNYLRYTVHH